MSYVVSPAFSSYGFNPVIDLTTYHLTAVGSMASVGDGVNNISLGANSPTVYYFRAIGEDGSKIDFASSFGYPGSGAGWILTSQVDLTSLLAGGKTVTFEISLDNGLDTVTGVLGSTTSGPAISRFLVPNAQIGDLQLNIQPINTYLSLGWQNTGVTFNDSDNVDAVVTDTDLAAQYSTGIFNVLGYPSGSGIKFNMVGGPPSGTTLYGFTGTTYMLTTDVQAIRFWYDGLTATGLQYDTGTTFTITNEPPVLTLSGVVGTATNDGRVEFIVDPSYSTYQDYNYPYAQPFNAIGGGNMVYADTTGVTAISTGLTFYTTLNDYPGAPVKIGYQSPSAISAGASFGIDEYYLPAVSNFNLPGVTWTNAIANPNSTVVDPYYFIEDLNIFGVTADQAITFGNNLAVLYNNVTYGPFVQSDGVGGGGTTYTNVTHGMGITYDAVGVLLAYSGITLAGSTLPPMYLGLTGSAVATTPADGVVHVAFSGVAYGKHPTTTSLSLNDGTIHTAVITSGSGGITYTGVPSGNFQRDYRVVIPGSTHSYNIISSNTINVMSPTPTTGTLVLDYVFGATAGQTYAFNILGEAGYTGIAFDQSIQLDIPVAVMSMLLAYSTNWPTLPGDTGSAGETYYQPEPDVLLALQSVVGPWLDSFTMGLTGTTTGTTYFALLDVVQGDAGTTCADLIKEFQSISGFTYNVGGTASDYLAGIPQEAIGSYNVSTIDTTPLSTVVGDQAVDTSYGTTTAATGLSGAIQSLFEQAIAVGMVQPGETLGVNLSSSVLTGGLTYGGALGGTTFPVYGASFSVGQSLSLYVRFNLQKNRSYQLQPFADLGTTGATGATFVVFGGVTFSLPSGLVESSTPVPIVYQIILNAV